MVKKNERKTEALVRKKLGACNYFDNDKIIVEEQSTDNLIIDKLLKNASKSGGGAGRPEFIIQSKIDREFIIIIECKADINKHASRNGDRPNDFAVDGVLHYANYLCRSFNVLSIAISGQTASELKISNFITRRGKFNKHDNLTDQYNNEVTEILAFENYFNLFIYL